MARSKRIPWRGFTPQNRKDHFPEEHDRMRLLGEGGEGEATLWRNKSSGDLVVAKIIQVNSRSRVLPNEIMVLRRLSRHNCDRVVQLLADEVNVPVPGLARLVLEYCEYGDLQGYTGKIEAMGRKVPEGFIWHVFMQLAHGLAFLHAGYGTQLYDSDNWIPMIHRDMKPANVLLTYNSPPGHSPELHSFPNIKIADLGLAGPEDRSKDGLGTIHWQPPESPLWTTAGDIWALGSIVHWLALGTPPVTPKGFESDTGDECFGNAEFLAKRFLLRAILPREVTEINTDEAGYSDPLNQWMLGLLAMNPAGRPRSVELVGRLAPCATQQITYLNQKEYLTLGKVDDWSTLVYPDSSGSEDAELAKHEEDYTGEDSNGDEEEYTEDEGTEDGYTEDDDEGCSCECHRYNESANTDAENEDGEYDEDSEYDEDNEYDEDSDDYRSYDEDGEQIADEDTMDTIW